MIRRHGEGVRLGSILHLRPALLLCALAALPGCALLFDLLGLNPAFYGPPLDNAGAVIVHLKNDSGYFVNVEVQYAINDQVVRNTMRRLAVTGVESEATLLATTTLTLHVTARVAGESPAALPTLNPGDLLLEKELTWGVDFGHGDTVTIVIPNPLVPPDIVDCNGNLVADATDLAVGTSTDCNCNNIPDECDIALGVLHDVSPADGVPDECVNCPPIEIVFILDTTASMEDEGDALCNAVPTVLTLLNSLGLKVSATLLGITVTPQEGFGCLTDNVADLLGTQVPGAPGCCPTLTGNEDWGPAVAIVAQRYAWSNGAIRMIVPISDEGPSTGDPCDDPGNDRDITTHAGMIAAAGGVIVSPIIGHEANPCVKELSVDLAHATGGRSFIINQSVTNVPAIVSTLLLEACSAANDCHPTSQPAD